MKKVVDKIVSENLDCLIVTKSENQRYITNFTGSTSISLASKDGITIFTDGRYMTQVQQEKYENVEVIIMNQGESLFTRIFEEINNSGYKKIAVESDDLILNQYLEIMELKSESQEIVPVSELIDTIREIKREDEVALMKEAVAITDKTYSYIREIIKPGMTESEVANYIQFKHKELGADKNSFDSIVASGINSAKPHAGASDKVIEEGDIVTLDFGCYYKGYASDMTRTFFVGEPKDEELVKIYNVVKETQKIQIDMLKDGVIASDVDKAGREYMKKFGYDKYFIHGTGHAVGLNVHENPRLNTLTHRPLKAGMVVTIEPGIYVEGLGGVRIENDVLITKDGYEILNQSKIDEY